MRRWLCRLICGPSLRRIENRLDAIAASSVAIEFWLRRLKMTTQEKLDALKDQIAGIGTQLATATAGIQQDIADLKTANPAVDFTAINATVAAVKAAADALTALDAENPAPSP